MEVSQKYITTLVRDPLIEPYAIGQEKHGGFAVVELKERINTKTGEATLRAQPVNFPSTFPGALDYIIRTKMCDQKSYNSIAEYIEAYKKLKEEVFNTLQ